MKRNNSCSRDKDKQREDDGPEFVRRNCLLPIPISRWLDVFLVYMVRPEPQSEHNRAARYHRQGPRIRSVDTGKQILCSCDSEAVFKIPGAVGVGFLTVFQCGSVDGWVRIYIIASFKRILAPTVQSWRFDRSLNWYQLHLNSHGNEI